MHAVRCGLERERVDVSGYVFWCSPCGDRHAGECPPRGKEGWAYPAIGTKWVAIPAPGSPQEPLVRREVFEVLAFDAAESCTVVVRAQGRGGRENSVQIEAWHDPAGGRCKEGPSDWFWKMEPA